MPTNDNGPIDDSEEFRLLEDSRHKSDWRLWGPYLPERQWGTVREDYSGNGDSWNSFTHDQARSRAYRWGEDGLLGVCDRECRLCFAPTFWNGRDPILKERLFGLTGPEGNHGEDVKECYYYLDASPTGSYLRALYKYPQSAYPYDLLVAENKRRSRDEPEFELIDTGIFDGNRYFDIFVEYVQAAPDDILVKLTAFNRGPDLARLDLLPTLWFRNTWSWGREGNGYWKRPSIRQLSPTSARLEHETLGAYIYQVEVPANGKQPELLFTDNESNSMRLWGKPNQTPYVKDAFHRYLVGGERDAINPAKEGTKVAAHYSFEVPGGGEQSVHVRFCGEAAAESRASGADVAELFARRAEEEHDYYRGLVRRYGSRLIKRDDGQAGLPAPTPQDLDELYGPKEAIAVRQCFAGLVWTTQFYHYFVRDWLEGDPGEPPPPPERAHGRNADWEHLHSFELISVPDKWEYPWFAAWDLAFHTVPFAVIDPAFAKSQLELMLRETYMHANGQIAAYEFGFGDVNPPVHAWAAYRYYKTASTVAKPDRVFLARVFQKLLLNFTWWVNRKDPDGKNIFSGGFLGLDNIGVFDRSKPLPTGGRLEQADGTAWMAFYCATMLSIALELASNDPVYEDIAYKFLEHFTSIVEAMHDVGKEGLWDEEDGFYYDRVVADGVKLPLKVRSMVGIIPLLAASVVESDMIEKLPDFYERVQWFRDNRKHLARHFQFRESTHPPGLTRGLLALPSRERLERVLRYVLDENEFLSPYGIRSLSRYHLEHPFVLDIGGSEYRVDYQPAESRSGVFGGNSNWRGPVWFPINYLLIEALEAYHIYYGDTFKVECPTGSGKMLTLREVAAELAHRLSLLFLPDENGRRPCHGDDRRYAEDPHWKDLVLFYEYFDGDTGKGLGASHQTGWTSLVMRCLRRSNEQWQRYQYEAQAEVPQE
ncbi:MAG: hypothetical protein Q7S58_17075 [Candidatus Binatus sp.]|uniref:MGH1-like glycoside hydrolase domain-containing protein n=1 Tax=Candidatus Binatus sp. TaxID=2811406 RepID=UPI002726409A|nr:hypothetical protein [Candidatus Binatus sp.]MDO8434113.1 hypothetical protein [Candidatus Binatus sp.]